MKSGYYQVNMVESNKCRTAFTVGPLWFFDYNKMSFCLSNSPATYQCLKEECLGDLNMKIYVFYLDDHIILIIDLNINLKDWIWYYLDYLNAI